MERGVFAKVLGVALITVLSIYLLYFGGYIVLSNALEKNGTVNTAIQIIKQAVDSRKNGDLSHSLLPGMALNVDNGDSVKGEGETCDIFSGKWVWNPSEPAYTNSTCKFIDDPQNCMKNGRPDSGYLYWKWKPNGCDLPSFDPQKFLNAMRNKAFVMIGDSIFRNHIESLLCLLSEIEEADEIYRDEEWKSKTWYFPTYNFTLAEIWSPFLLAAEIFEDNEGVSKYDIQLHLDSLESKWTSQYHNFDYVVLSGGQWFLKTVIFWDNNTVIGCHYCPGRSLDELGFDFPYRKALKLTYDFIISSPHKPLVIFRTWAPDHFEYGQWYNGGFCNRTQPLKEGQFNGDYTDRIMYELEIEEFNKAVQVGSKNGTRITLLDTYKLSLLRADGHPGPYRYFYPNLTVMPQNDCLHWCLPGPIDYWNDLLMEILFNEDSRYLELV